MSLKISGEGLFVDEEKLDFGDFEIPFSYLSSLISKGTNGKEVKRFSSLCKLVSHNELSRLKRSSREDLLEYLGNLSGAGYKNVRNDLDDYSIEELRSYCHGVVSGVRSHLEYHGVTYREKSSKHHNT